MLVKRRPPSLLDDDVSLNPRHVNWENCVQTFRHVGDFIAMLREGGRMLDEELGGKIERERGPRHIPSHLSRGGTRTEGGLGHFNEHADRGNGVRNCSEITGIKCFCITNLILRTKEDSQ